MKFKKKKNVNTIEYFAQCVCAMASCSCMSCGCTCYGTRDFQDTHVSPRESNIYSKYSSQAYVHELA